MIPKVYIGTSLPETVFPSHPPSSPIPLPIAFSHTYTHTHTSTRTHTHTYTSTLQRSPKSLYNHPSPSPLIPITTKSFTTLVAFAAFAAAAMRGITTMLSFSFQSPRSCPIVSVVLPWSSISQRYLSASKQSLRLQASGIVT